MVRTFARQEDLLCIDIFRKQESGRERFSHGLLSTLPWWGAPASKSDRSLVMANASSEEAVQQYSSLLEQINSSPYQRDLHLERVRLATQLGLSDEVEQGRQAYAQFLALSPGRIPGSYSALKVKS